jgi:ribonuclease E
MPTPELNAEIIAAAIEGFESQKRRIDTQIGELRAMLSGGRTEGTVAPEASKPKRKVSAAARRRMAEGQKKRWAAIKAESKKPQSAARLEPAKPKRKMSAAGRRAISEATRRRWALKRAETAKAQPAGAKKAATPKTAAKKTTAKKAAAKPAKKAAKAAGQAARSEAVAQ